MEATPAEVAGLIRSGKLLEARAALAERTGYRDLIERARIALHFGEYAQAEALAERAVSVAPPRNGRSLARALRLAARAGAGAPENDAVELAEVGRAELALTIYYVAMAAYFRNDFAAAGAWLGSHAPTQPATRARYLMLRGFVAAGKGDVAAQLECSDTALRLLRREAPDESYLLAQAAHVVALLVRELPCDGYGDALEALERELDWPPELELMRFGVLRALGWKRALLGDYEGAMAHLLRATFVTDDRLLRAYAHLDHASVAVFAGERASARAAFAASLAIIEQTDWPAVHSEAIAVLPFAAQVAAELGEGTTAQRLCRQAAALQPQIDARWALAHDGRFAAFLGEATAFAYFDRDRDRALLAGEAAYATFAQLGYAWRAGRLAALLASGTALAAWHERAEHWLAYYGTSPLRRLLRAPAAPALSPRQREVHRLMAQGKTGSQIATELGISTFTVRNHERLVMRAYGVHRRIELLERAR
ncbi:MAG TPA: LuxR C-terminal-related transcriptional regulator [Verrucomicrobiae bacterium]|nr:LuxR C-terminal-related transcriptional regulator [Verrucomicrobiae bacterium]